MKKMKLSRKNKMFAGVCGGISEYFGLDPSLVRIIFALLVLLGRGLPIVIYLVCWAVIPLDDDII